MARFSLRSSASSRSSQSGSSAAGADTPVHSDTQSVRSGLSDWTTASTTETVTDAAPDGGETVSVSLHPLATRDGLIAKITPPQSPSKKIDHVPCDIVLVIDVSGSMGSNAPVPANPGEKAENFGLSILDLVKHASRTILSTMNASDRLGIVTFGSSAKVLQGLTPMNEAGKKKAEANIKSMQPTDATNLWHGILEGVKLFKQGGETGTGRVPAIMVLTDGMPNYMCPPQGYVPKLRGMEELPASLHTFGFGYSLRSGLLKSIAEIGRGNYAFIPDAGMIGTVFVHAVANLQATFATNAILRLTYPANFQLEETTGQSVDKLEPITMIDEPEEPKQLSIALGNLQYGQSRDIFLKVKLPADYNEDGSTISAVLEYSRMTSNVYRQTTQKSFLTATTLPESEIAYQKSRSEICSFLSSLFPLRDDGEHEAVRSVSKYHENQLKSLIEKIPAKDYGTEPKNKSLLEDLSGEAPKGQISIALKNPSFYSKWGVHYLPSLLNAHTRQICNTFKDSGPLQYGAESPLFISCRDKLDSAFDDLPAPTPSNKHTATSHGRIAMSHYNSSAGVCFAASTQLQMASGQYAPISSLRKGSEVQTPLGSRKVSAVLKTVVKKELMCRVDETVVTPWHPVSQDGVDGWVFPASIADHAVEYTGSIYSILLEADSNPSAHVLVLQDGLLGITLGHGVISGEDIRAHAFFGDYEKVMAALQKLGINRKTGVAIGAGAKRSRNTGLVVGFRKRNLATIVRKRDFHGVQHKIFQTAHTRLRLQL